MANKHNEQTHELISNQENENENKMRHPTLLWVDQIDKIKKIRASLVAQWLRTRLPMQRTWVRAVVQEDPTCCRATKPGNHNQ